MKKYICILLAMVCLLSLAGCACEHQWLHATGGHGQICDLCGESQNTDEPHTWLEASCLEAKKCTVCGITEGVPLGHVFDDAAPDCENPKLCSTCGAPEAEAKPHGWVDATCEAPKTCTVCGMTEGEALDHSWKDATCSVPKICARCGKIEGKALDHIWNDATCETPMSCALCGGTVDEALGHTWTDATCKTPQTCARCGATKGKPLGHTWADATAEAPKSCTVCGALFTDPRFSVDACQGLLGHWEGEYIMTGEMMGDPTLPDMPVILSITFRNDGSYTDSARMADKAGYIAQMEQYYIQALYAEFENQYGMTQEQADQTMLQAYGMDVKAYAKVIAAAIDYDALLAASGQEGVYYVADGKLYSGPDWDTLEEEELRLEGNTLTMSFDDLWDVTLTRVDN